MNTDYRRPPHDVIRTLRPRLLRALQACNRWCHPGLSRSIPGLIAIAEDPRVDELKPWERTYRVRLVLVAACNPHGVADSPMIRSAAFESLVDRATAKVEQVRRILTRRGQSVTRSVASVGAGHPNAWSNVSDWFG